MKIGKDGWLELDVGMDMNAAQREAFEAYKDAYRVAKELRTVYENEMQAAAPEGKAYVFGYNFGKASVKLVNAEDRPKATAKAKSQVSLRDYLDAMTATGARA